MLQDLDYGRLDNQYRKETPNDNDIVVCVQGKGMLVHRESNDELSLPTWAQAKEWSNDWNRWHEDEVQYIFTMQDVRYFLWMGEAGDLTDTYYTYEPAMSLRQRTSKNICFAMMTAWHLYNWYRVNRYCGNCAAPTVHDEKERMMRCPDCNVMMFPQICPAVIIGLTHGDKILLSKYRGRNYKDYALLAGFAEIGETIEETVKREVWEEVGVHVKNIRYYKSQPWPHSGSLLLGFFAELDGDDESIQLEEEELSMAVWMHRHDLPMEADGISLTNEMIMWFKEHPEDF